MSPKQRKRLVVSFIGRTDLEYIEPKDGNLSPVIRMLIGLSTIKPYILPSATTLVLFDDDRPDDRSNVNKRSDPISRANFIERIEEKLPGLGLNDLAFSPIKFSVDRPTDYHGLYVQLGQWLTKLKAKSSFDEVFFHITSGTPHMQVTLMLYASTFPPGQVRLFETSKHVDGSVQEIHLPYLLASREDSRATGGRSTLELDPAAQSSLIENTVVEDSAVAEIYQALYRAATGSRRPSRILINGSIGSGKWHACRQFAVWRGQTSIIIADAQSVPPVKDIATDATVLVHRLDKWQPESLVKLSNLLVTRADLSVAATFRTGRSQTYLQEVLSDGIPGAVHLNLPPLDRRADRIKLGEALARQNGIADGKLHARFQHDWMTDVFPRGLHDLQTLVTTGALLSETKHPERESYRRVADALAAHDVLNDAWEILKDLQSNPTGISLEQVEEDIRRATILLALAKPMSQKAVASLAGLSQQTVSRVAQSGTAGFHLTRQTNQPEP